ncbi:ArsS family sensor histidine kinase [Helicobacter macacae]|nr:ArsS family sensor histidine kinase [Helicobacter macacae]
MAQREILTNAEHSVMKHSIFFKITILFLFALGSFFAFSFYFLRFQAERYAIDNERQRYERVSIIFNHIISKETNLDAIQIYLKEMGFIQVNDNNLKKNLLDTTKILYDTQGIYLKSIELNNDMYILLTSENEVFLYKDSLRNFYVNYYLIILFGSMVLIFLFVLVIKSLLPMIYLRRQIRRFAKGDTSVECEIPQKDEIGELASEFDKAIKRISALNSSRTLFLRSIMHELKTPITKGRITAEMVRNKTQKLRLTSVFERLNALIDEFAKIEQLSSKNYNLKKTEFFLYDLIENIQKMLLIDTSENNPIQNHAPNEIIKADFELFCLSVKNLIDNGIKYSFDGKVDIQSNGRDIIISNHGNALKMEFEEYFKPYFKDSAKPNSQGFGLGMYIIKNTLDAQNFTISYRHDEDSEGTKTNYFVIHNCIVESFCNLPTNHANHTNSAESSTANQNGDTDIADMAKDATKKSQKPKTQKSAQKENSMQKNSIKE